MRELYASFELQNTNVNVSSETKYVKIFENRFLGIIWNLAIIYEM